MRSLLFSVRRLGELYDASGEVRDRVVDDIHRPVMVAEVLRAFADCQMGVFFDGTVGAGGHAHALLGGHPEIGRYVACDCDPQAIAYARQVLRGWEEKVEWVVGNFGQLAVLLEQRGVAALDGCLFDLGISSRQLADPQRGFSFQQMGPLDMRIDPDLQRTAAEVVNRFGERQLAELLQRYGEVRGKRVARAIVEARVKQSIATTEQLEGILFRALRGRRGRIHPATLGFQALRIFVNRELEMLEEGIGQALRLLRSGGRIAVLSFHSLEDRIVKRAFACLAAGSAPRLRVLTKKPLTPTGEEVRGNRRARSAKLRVAEKL